MVSFGKAIAIGLFVVIAITIMVMLFSPTSTPPPPQKTTTLPAAAQPQPPATGVASGSNTTPVSPPPIITDCLGPKATYNFVGESISPGTTLNHCQGIKSADGKYITVQQSDGNLVIYNTHTAAPIWALKNWDPLKAMGISSIPNRTVYQNDYNLVVYNKDNAPLWASNTVNKNSNRLIMQNDGNLVMYTATGAFVWATGTNGK